MLAPAAWEAWAIWICNAATPRKGPMVSVVTMKTATAEDEGLPSVVLVAVCLHEKWETPNRLWSTDRIEEIESWLHRYHQGEPFLVLDDDYSGTSLTGIDEDIKHPLAARVVLCNVGVGLTIKHLP